MKINKKLSIAALALFMSLTSYSPVQAQENDNLEIATSQARTAGNWEKSKDDWFYVVGGVKQTGWTNVGGTWYYLNTNGAMATGWTNVGGTWYYLNADGSMAKGWTVVGSTWYYLNVDGSMATGWTNVSGTWYYLNADGSMATGWIVIDGTWYYLNADGSMAKGWLLDGDSWFYLNADGSMATNWLMVNGAWYYLDAAGRMLTNTTLGNWEIDENGVATEIVKSNKELLIEAIAAVEGFKAKDYSQDGDSWANFTTALDAAKAMVKNNKATELEMAVALTNLEKATDQLVLLTADKVALFTAIKAEEAKELIESDYTPESWKAYQAALKEAKRVYADNKALQSEVNEALKSLEEAKLEVILTGRPVLEAAIKEAKETYLTNPEVEKDYTKDSWAAFKAALEAAEEVYNEPNYTDSMIQTAIDNLEKAIDQLVTVDGNAEELAGLLAELQNAKEKAKQKADFSEKSFKAFDQALVKADAVFAAQEKSSSKEIREAKADLVATMAALVNVKELKAEIALAEKITNEADYTPKTWKAFAEALEKAIEVLANPEAPKTAGEADLDKADADLKVSAATTELKTANSKLVYIK